MECDVLFFIPKDTWKGVVSGILPNRGILSLASLLEKQGYAVKIIDLNLYEMAEDKLLEAIGLIKPRIIGITSSTYKSRHVLCLARVIKEHYPEILIVTGGPHFSYQYQEALSEGFDLVVLFEAEETLPKVVKAFLLEKAFEGIDGIAFKKGCHIVYNKPKRKKIDMNQFPLPAYHLVEMSKYNTWVRKPGVINLHTSRGCAHACSFCTVSSYWVEPSFIKAEKIIEEVIFLRNKYMKEFFIFTDDDFLLFPDNFNRFCRLILKKKLNIKWMFKTRMTNIIRNHDLIKRARLSGAFMVMSGIESYSNEKLSDMNKATSTEEIYKANDILVNEGYLRWYSYILGFPGDSISDFQATYLNAKRLDADLVTFIPLTPFPGNEYWSAFKHSNLPYSLLDLSHPVFAPPEVSLRRLERIINQYYLRYYLRPKYLRKLIQNKELKRRLLFSFMINGFRIFLNKMKKK